MEKISKKSLWESCEKFERKLLIFYGRNLEKKFVKKLWKFRDKSCKKIVKKLYFLMEKNIEKKFVKNL